MPWEQNWLVNSATFQFKAEKIIALFLPINILPK